MAGLLGENRPLGEPERRHGAALLLFLLLSGLRRGGRALLRLLLAALLLAEDGLLQLLVHRVEVVQAPGAADRRVGDVREAALEGVVTPPVHPRQALLLAAPDPAPADELLGGDGLEGVE